MPIPGSPEWEQRLADLLAEEATQPETWWFLSFASDEAFLGGCVIKARGIATAIRRAHALGINPGGQVMAVQGPACDQPPGLPIDRLLSREELGPGETVGEMEDRGILPGKNVRFSD